jgi:hypothetical protein
VENNERFHCAKNTRDILSENGDESVWSTSTKSTHIINRSMPFLPEIEHNKTINARTQGHEICNNKVFYSPTTPQRCSTLRPHHKGVLLPGYTTKVFYSLLGGPHKDESFSTLILHKPTTKVKGITFSNFSQRAGDTNFLGSSTKLEIPKQPESSRNPMFQE